jgi:protein O-mannosyl-transferase
MIFSRSRRQIITVLLLGFILCAAALYVRGFSGPMYGDSVEHLEENSSVFASESVLEVIKIAPQRPVAMLSFYIDYRVAGLSPYYLRLVSVALLGVTSLALFFLIILVLNIPTLQVPADTAQKQAIAFICSVVFLVHPVQSQVVLYIWQRMTLLACLFYLLSLSAYLGTRMGIIRSQVLGFSLCAALFLCAILSKENAVTLPAAIILAEIILFKQRLRAVLVLIATASLLVVIASVPFVFLERMPGTQETGMFHMIKLYYRISGLTPLEVALTQSRMLFDYLFLSLVPFLTGLPFWVAPVISRSLLNPPSTVLAVVGVFALIGLSLALLRRQPLTSFGILFFILNLIPESALLPTHTFFAYRVLLPLVGLILAVADLALVGYKWAESRGMNLRVKAVLAGMLAIWIAASAATAFSKAAMWTDPVLVWEEAVRNLPSPEADFDKMHYLTILDNLGYELQLKGRHKEAVPYHERSLNVVPTNLRALTLMATALAGTGDIEKAEPYFKKVLESPAADARTTVFARIMYGESLERAGRKPEAADQYGAALNTRPDMASWQRKLGRLLIELGQPREAVKRFGKAVELEPESAEAHYDLATALQAEGKLDEAINHYVAALRLRPDHAWAYNNLGRIMEAKGDVAAALKYYANALQHDRNMPEGHFNIGNALVALNKLDEAMLHYRSVITIRPDYAQAHNNLGVVLEEKGDFEQAAEHYKLALQLKPDEEIFSKNLARVMEKLPRQRGDVPH